MLLINNTVIIDDPLKGSFRHGESILVEGTEIKALGPTSVMRESYPDAQQMDGKSCFLLPGLVDAHTHLYGALIGAKPPAGDPPQNFPQVLDRVWWLWDRALRDEDVKLSALMGSLASLRSGVTTIFDHHASPSTVPDSLSLLAEEINKCGLRACLSYETSDRNGPDSFKEGVAENRRFILDTNRQSNDMLKGIFGMHAVFSLSDESLHRCGQAAAELDAGCHLHVAEHLAEVEKFAKSHQQSIPEFLAEVGILGPKSLMAHTVHFDEQDIKVVKSTDTFNVHNPRSNMSNGVGIAKIPKMFDMGQPVCLGSDGFFDLPHETGYARMLQIVASGNPSAFSEKQALTMLYDHNVKLGERIFGCRMGKIAPGYKADIILMAYDPIAPIEEENHLSHVLGALTAGQVKSVIINGKFVMRDNEILDVDESQVMANARIAARDIWKRFSE
jgi:putative selenium metabolism protein SsnA